MTATGAFDGAFFLRLFQATPHPYLILGADPGYPILAVNERYLEATGTRREAILGLGLFEVFPDNPESGGGVSDLRASLDRVRQDRRPDTMGVQKYDIPLRDGSGGFEVRYWSPVNTPVFDPAGGLAWIIHHVEDVTAFVLQAEKLARIQEGRPGRIQDRTDRMEAEVMRRAAEVKDANRALKTAMEELERSRTELAAANGRLSEMDRLKSDLFANISHELRTPLTLILGPLGQRLEDPGLDPGLRRDLGRMERNARILLARVNDLLDLARLDAGRMELRLEDVDLARLVRLEAARFESLAAEQGAALDVEAQGVLAVRVDPEKVRRILANLLANAFKFTPAGGRVRVRLRVEDGQEVLEVGDSGPGIPEPMRELVFDRFRQVESGPGRRQGGTGLGLAIVREFAQVHGGAVALTENAGGGALFRVSLPFRAPDAEPPAPAGDTDAVEVPELHQWRPEPGLALEGPAADAPRVLVVEDNGDMRDFLARTLAQRYRVSTAVDGADGLRQALADPPDLVVSDVMMPQVTGDQLVAELRRSPATEDLPVILLTAKADQALRVKMLLLGVGDYLFKPFSFDELLARVAALLEGRQKGRIASQVQESRFQAMFEQAAVGMAQLSLDGRVLRANQGLADLLGYRPEELQGMRFQDLTDPADLEEDVRQVQQLLRGEGTSFSREKRYVKKDGSRAWGNRTVSLVRHPAHGEGSLFAVVEDIGARKEAQEELLRLQAELEARVKERTADLQNANQELDTFAYTVTHDLRAPLRAMGGFSRALVEDLGPRLTGEERQSLDQIILASVRMSDLIEGILQLSRITRGGLARESVDLTALAGIIRLELELGEPGRSVVWDVEEGLRAWGDPVMLEVLLRNLLGNAWKYTARVSPARIGLHAQPGADRFQVTDNGAGFDMAWAGKLFQPFHRMHRQDQFPGLGIGLATVFRIVRRHGGSIEAQAEPGKGARFTFSLPGPEPPR